MKNSVLGIFLFFVITTLISWIVWAPAYLFSAGTVSSTVLISIGSFSPLVAAIIMVWHEEKIPGVKKLLLRGIAFRMRKFAWIYLLLIPFSAAAASLIGQSRCSMKGSFSLLEHPQYIIPVFVMLMLFGGPLGGEFGWRGYVLDKLNSIMDPFFSAIAVCVMWCVWQFPLFYIPGTAQNATSMPMFLLVTLMVSILMTILYLRTHCSVGWAVIMHSFVNLSFGIFSIYVSNCRTVYFLSIISVITGIAVIIEHKMMFPSEQKKLR